ncbi:MAG: hypothetical protein WCG45_02330 [bacterium]
MYDLEIIMPVDLSNEIIKRRFDDFIEWGFFNHEQLKIKLFFMASNDTKEEDLKKLENSFPENFETSSIITPYKHVSQRIIYYYSDIIKPDTAKWYMRIDEDSLTDLGSLMNNLENEFDHTRDYYIVGEINREIVPIERKILSFLGFNCFYNKIQGHDLRDAPAHEFEVSITSNEAVKRILNNENCQKFFQIRKEFAEGVGDHTFCLAALIEKIYPISVRFLTYHPNATQFSIFGGIHNHIHHLSFDRNPEFLRWLKSIKKGENEELVKEITSEENLYFLNWYGRSDKSWISFNKNGRIEKNMNVSDIFKKEIVGIWAINKNGQLTVFMNELHENNTLIVLNYDGGAFYCLEKKMRIELKNVEIKRKKILM